MVCALWNSSGRIVEAGIMNIILIMLVITICAEPAAQQYECIWRIWWSKHLLLATSDIVQQPCHHIAVARIKII